jgi:hypothetical protein
MKALILQIIDGFEVVIGVSNPTIDPVETENAVNLILSENPDIKKTKTLEELYAENAVPAHNIPNQKLVEDSEGGEFQAALDRLSGHKEPLSSGETADEGDESQSTSDKPDNHKKLLSSGAIIDDWRNTEYWVKGQTWEKQKIETLGETPPADGILEENLTESQRKEMAEEKEIKRISKLTPEKRNTEKQDRLNALKREATLLKSDAEIAGETFDAPAWFQEKKAELEAKYGA